MSTYMVASRLHALIMSAYMTLMLCSIMGQSSQYGSQRDDIAIVAVDDLLQH